MPSHVYVDGKLPPFATVALANVNTVPLPPALGFTTTLADAAPIPCALLAATVHAYDVSLTNPVTVIGLRVPTPVFASPAAAHVAVYARIVDPPVDDGTVNAMLAVVLPAVAVTLVSVPGTVTLGVTGVVVVSLRAQANRPPTNTHNMTRQWRGESNGIGCIERSEGV